MNGRLSPISTMSSRRSTVIVADELSGTFLSVVAGWASGVWLSARAAAAATAVMAAPVRTALRPIFADGFFIGYLAPRHFICDRTGDGAVRVSDPQRRTAVSDRR